MLTTNQLTTSIFLALSSTGCIADTDTTPAPVEGPHYSFVVSDVRVSATAKEAITIGGLDLNGDGKVDNELGRMFGILSTYDFNVQPTLTELARTGRSLLAVDVQTPNLANAQRTGVQLLTGISALPSPCSGATDASCGHHLDGNGTIVVNAPTKTMYSTGFTVDGSMHTTGGLIPVRLAFDATNFIDLNLHDAHLQIDHIDATGATGLWAGGISVTDKDTILIPQLAANLQRIATAAHCEWTANTVTCSDSPRAQDLLFYLDFNHDLMISEDEVRKHFINKVLLSPDVSIDNVEYISFGFSVTLVPATLTYR
jgi:hypothetical protein